MALRRRNTWGVDPIQAPVEPTGFDQYQNDAWFGSAGRPRPEPTKPMVPETPPPMGTLPVERTPITPGGGEGTDPSRDLTGLNFDGYAPPAWLPEGNNFGGPLQGWDPTKWADMNHWSPKYTVGRLMGQFGTGPEFEAALLRAFPGARLEGDRLYFADGSAPVDIFYDEEGARRPQWITDDGGADDGLPGFGGGAGIGGIGGAGGGMGAGGDGFSSSFGPGDTGDVMSLLRSFTGGDLNSSIIDSRLEKARNELNRFKKDALADDRGILAERGIAGMGPEITALSNLEGDLAGMFAGELQGIFADESANADERTMRALSDMAQLAGVQSGHSLGWGRLGLDRELGLGQLALGQGRLGLDNRLADQDYDLGLGRLGLDRDQLAYLMQNGDMETLIELLRILMGEG